MMFQKKQLKAVHWQWKFYDIFMKFQNGFYKIVRTLPSLPLFFLEPLILVLVFHRPSFAFKRIFKAVLSS